MSLKNEISSIQKINDKVGEFMKSVISHSEKGEMIVNIVDEEDIKIMVHSISLLQKATTFLCQEVEAHGLLEEKRILTREAGDFDSRDTEKVTRSRTS